MLSKHKSIKVIAALFAASVLFGCSTPSSVTPMSANVTVADGVIAPEAATAAPTVMTASARAELPAEPAVVASAVPATSRPAAPETVASIAGPDSGRSSPGVAAPSNNVASANPVTLESAPKQASAYTADGYPNINITPPRADVELMSEDERAKIQSELRNLSSAHAAASGSLSPARKAQIEAALQRMAAKHRQEAAEIDAAQ